MAKPCTEAHDVVDVAMVGTETGVTEGDLRHTCLCRYTGRNRAVKADWQKSAGDAGVRAAHSSV